jgi:hypothetical protein
MMDERRSIDALKQRGSEKPAPEAVAALYRQAFLEFGSQALWSSQPSPHPTLASVLAITESLRVEGNRDARRLAERLEEACRAAL